MIPKIFAGAALAGALALGSVSVAAADTGSSGASSPTTTATSGTGTGTHTHAHLCTNRAPKILLRIETFNQKYQAWLPKAEARLAKEQQANNQGVVSKIQNRLNKAKARQAKLATVQAKITAECPGVIPATSKGSSSSSTTTTG
ncbi:MAG TPA: hypothetical protein VKG43_05125 [Acidimicrobiales bacterium]|nr:hypothetical protein [Acidimicrobiales bacterium]